MSLPPFSPLCPAAEARVRAILTKSNIDPKTVRRCVWGGDHIHVFTTDSGNNIKCSISTCLI